MARVLTMGGVIPLPTNKPTWLSDTVQRISETHTMDADTRQYIGIAYLTDADTRQALFGLYQLEGDILIPVVLTVRSDGRVDPLGLHVARGGQVEILPPIRESTEEIPGRDGTLDFGINLGARGLELRLASDNSLTRADIETIKRFIAYRLDPRQGMVRLQWEDFPDRYLDLRVASTIETEEFRDGMVVVLPLKATSPFYIGTERFTFTGSGTLATNGNTIAPCRVTVAGPVTNPAVTIGDYSFTWTGAVGSADLLLVDSEKQIVTFNGVNALAGFAGDFPMLHPGDNLVTAAATGVTTVLWRDRWI